MGLKKKDYNWIDEDFARMIYYVAALAFILFGLLMLCPARAVFAIGFSMLFMVLGIVIAELKYLAAIVKNR